MLWNIIGTSFAVIIVIMVVAQLVYLFSAKQTGTGDDA